MVADSANDGAVGNRDFTDMRRIDDKLAPIGYHWFELVHAFATHPQLIVHQRRAREHGVERVLLISNVQLPGQIACLVPGAFGRPDKQSRQLRVIHHHTETELGHCDHRGGAIHDLSYRVYLLPMIMGLVITAPSQWKKLSTSGPLTLGKRYLLPPGKANHLVRKYRTDNDD